MYSGDAAEYIAYIEFSRSWHDNCGFLKLVRRKLDMDMQTRILKYDLVVGIIFFN